MLHDYVLRLKQVDECLDCLSSILLKLTRWVQVMSRFVYIYIYGEVVQTKRPWQHVCLEHMTYKHKVPESMHVCLREQLLVSSLRFVRASFISYGRLKQQLTLYSGHVLRPFKCNFQMTSYCEVLSSGESGNNVVMRLCKTCFITK